MPYPMLFLAFALALSPFPAQAQTIAEVFESAWRRSSPASGAIQRGDALLARRDAADLHTPAPPSLELGGRSDRLNQDRGARELEVGVALQLWLPGEQDRTRALAEAERGEFEARLAAARLRLAAEVREAWWAWQLARIDQASAGSRRDNALALARDVDRRVAAGSLARADAHQAQGALAAAEAELAEISALLASAAHRIAGLSGIAPRDASAAGEPPPESLVLSDAHPLLAELARRAETARNALDLAATQKRANSELTLSTRRGRADYGAPGEQTIAIALRLPFSSEPRNRARILDSNATLIEAEAQQRVERRRLEAVLSAARERLQAAQRVEASAQRRAQLARETRGFFDRSFRLGETDLPTRLRIEIESNEANRQAARAAVQHAAAVSNLRQSLGLTPQ